MKKILLFLLLTVTTNSFAQLALNKLPKPGIISGKVIDANTKEALPYVNIIVKDMSNNILTGGITDEKGNFVIKKIPEGNSKVEIQFIGYKTVTKSITVNSKKRKLSLGTIPLSEDSTNLEEVEVRAETSTIVQKVDRKVINVGKDLTAAGTTASELLNNVQSVSVDSQTGNISLRGNENVRVLVDGKPSNIPVAQLLKQIPSSSIKSVELITNPSAKYNPEGMSGIINIVLNKNANMGFNGSLDTGFTMGHYVRYNGSTNMNYKTGKVNFFANYGHNSGKSLNFGYVNRPGTNNQDFRFINDNTSHLLKVGADIYLDKKNTLSFYTSQNWFDSNTFGNAIITLNNGTVFENSPNSQISESKNETYNVNYKHDINDKGENIEFEATYSENNAPNLLDNDFLQNTQPDYENDISNLRKNVLLNLDYTNPITDKTKVELGLEYRKNFTENTNKTTQVGFNNSSFDYDRKIISGYVNLGHQFGKVSMQLGTRIEQFEVDANFNVDGTGSKNIKDYIFTFYPSAFFTYNPSEKNQWQLSYSRRVDRPNIQQVNPIREWSTPLITSIGNENLTPQFTNSLELNYTRKIKNGSLTFGTFYRKINDVISRVTYADPSDVNNVRQILSYANFEDTDSYGLEFSANYKVNNWWRINSSMDFYSQKQFGTTDLNNPNSRIEVQNEVFNARISNSFKASKDLRFQLFGMYRGSQKDIQWKTEHMWMVNAGASLNVLKGKGTLSFRVNDIFKGMKFGFNSTNPYVQNGQFNWESQTTYIGFNYRFGSGKNKAKRRRQRDDNEKQNQGGF